MKASSIHNILKQPSVHNNKPNIIDTSLASNTSDEKKTVTWCWNENVNETDSDEEEKEEDIEHIDRKAKTE